MRNLISLVEAATITPSFLQEVRDDVDLIGHGQWEFTDDQDLTKRITALMHQIEHHAGHGGKYIIERAELRPEDHIPHGLVSVGCHWSWESNAAAVYHDNATDNHGDDTIEIVMVSIVDDSCIDWAFTIATNLVLHGEKEITLIPGSDIKIEAVWIGDMEQSVDVQASVDGDYRDR